MSESFLDPVPASPDDSRLFFFLRNAAEVDQSPEKLDLDGQML